jgi:hypothetical protein
MNRAVALMAILLCGAASAQAKLTGEQIAAAERITGITVPSPAEFFAAIDKAGKPDWVSFYRQPVPTTYPSRPQTAVNLGALVTDGFVAVEAQDGQQVKNIGKDIITLSRALGVGEDVLNRGKSISDFADKNDWTALREELEATTNEVRRAMADQRDDALSALITAGAWLRALQVGSRAAELSGEEESAALLRQPALVAYLQSCLERLPEKARGGPVFIQVDTTLGAVGRAMSPTKSETFGPEQVLAVQQSSGQLISEMEAKQP